MIPLYGIQLQQDLISRNGRLYSTLFISILSGPYLPYFLLAGTVCYTIGILSLKERDRGKEKTDSEGALRPHFKGW